jgi:hypothetical protein
MAKEGYLLYVRGDRTINLSSTALPLPSSNTILRATGTLLTGPQSFTGLYGNSEFNLVTNPYASAINWASVRAASTNLSPYYTLWDPNIASQGGYVTIHTSGLNGTPGSNANVNIQSGQAFFVQSSAGSTSATVNILETHKSSSNNVDVFRLGSQTEMFTSSLFYTNAGGTRINADGVTSVYNNSYSSVVDEDDAVQMANWEEDIAISRTGSFLSIEGRPLIDQTDTIPFIVSRLQPRTYEWQFTASNFNHPDLQAVLVDQFLNTRTPIVLTGTTVITFTVTADPASAAAGRFMVVFGTNNTLPVNMTSVKAYQKGQHIQVEWTVQTEVAMKHYEVEKSTTGAQFSKTAVTAARGNNAATTYSWLDVNAVDGANYYRIKAVGNNGDVQYTKVVRMNIGKMVSEVISYPNPLTDNTISLSVNLPKGSYSVTLTNALGQQVFKIQLMHQGGAATQALPIGTKLAEGVYQLTVSDGVSRFVQPIIKQ